MNDLISRSALLEQYEWLKENVGAYNHAELDEYIQRIKNAPAVDAEVVRHGRWIHTKTEDEDWGGTFHKFTCSACDWSMGDNPSGWGNFCPNCGAKMDGDKNAAD